MSTQTSTLGLSPFLPLSPSPSRGHCAIVAAALLIAIALPLGASETAIQAARPANWRATRPPVEALRPLPPAGDLIAALNSPQYAEREESARLLTRHGQHAVPLLEEAARSGRPEAAIRAMNALEGLWLRAIKRQDISLPDIVAMPSHRSHRIRAADQQDIAAAEAALKAMDQLRGAGDPVLLDRVNAIFAMHAPKLYEYSMHQVQRLGGSIRFFQHVRGFNHDETSQPEIEYIIIRRGWTGGLDGLRHVRRLSPRGVYFIKGADLPENIVEIFHDVPLEEHIPAVSRGASHLGVSTNPELAVQACHIKDVEPGSAAAQAGMKSGDVIVNFNDVEIGEFQDLVDQIALIEPGQTVPATVRRDGDMIELDVTLQEWK